MSKVSEFGKKGWFYEICLSIASYGWFPKSVQYELFHLGLFSCPSLSRLITADSNQKASQLLWWDPHNESICMCDTCQPILHISDDFRIHETRREISTVLVDANEFRYLQSAWLKSTLRCTAMQWALGIHPALLIQIPTSLLSQLLLVAAPSLICWFLYCMSFSGMPSRKVDQGP